MWKALVAELYPDHTFAPPASESEIATLESSLGIVLPAELRDLLDESNGVEGPYSLGLVWPSRRIASDNLTFRTTAGFAEVFMPFDPLLFFGDAGNGDQFAFAILAGAVRRSDVFAWDHETDSRTWVAPDLRRYLEWWADGRITL
jgi:hypothetical protein